MPDVQSSTLRIYCLCGQKMRVSEKMYGLPGKCVACRQKIRIPKKEDVPDGMTGIYLKDHPELVRGPAKISAEERSAQQALAKAGGVPETDEKSTPNTELDLPDSPPPKTPAPSRRKKSSSRGSLAVDVLPILQVLCSLDYKFTRELDALQINSHDDEVLLAELEGHQTRVRKLRSHLDDQLHQRLMETAIELSNTTEKLAQARLGARVGETTWSEYQNNVHRLRMRRDRLERRQQNLRGWLATHDPYLAGGLLDLSVDNVPDDGFAVTLPPESSDDSAQLAELIEGLRSALENRAQVRQRAAEVQRMSDGNGGGKEVAELRRECEQQRLLARARVAFAHDRLQQLKKDYSSDSETANAMLAAARDKLRMDAIARPEYDTFERDILRSKKDLARAQAVIERALGANAADDVPSAQGTFVNRLGVGGTIRTLDMLLAYGAAVLLGIAVLLPSLGTLSLAGAALEFGASGGAALWLALGPLALAGAVAGITFVHDASKRSWLYLTAWFLGFVATALIIHESGYSLDPLAARFRSAAQWYLQPGVAVLLAGIFCVLGAALATNWRRKDGLAWPAIVAIAGFTAAGLIATDVGGALTPQPSLSVDNEGGNGAGVVRISNQGGRSIHLLNRHTDARGSYQFFIDERVGTSSFREAAGEGPLWDAPPADGRFYTIGSGAHQDLPFVLPPGEYRAVLESDAMDEPIVVGFAVRPPPAATETTPSQEPPAPATPIVLPPQGTAPVTAQPIAIEPDVTSIPDESAADESNMEEALDEPVEELAPLDPNASPIVQLIGIMTAENQEPRFSLRLYHSDGTEDKLVLAMGGVVWKDWTITEFNPDQNTVTLESTAGMLILRRGVETEFALPGRSGQ